MRNTRVTVADAGAAAIVVRSPVVFTISAAISSAARGAGGSSSRADVGTTATRPMTMTMKMKMTTRRGGSVLFAGPGLGSGSSSAPIGGRVMLAGRVAISDQVVDLLQHCSPSPGPGRPLPGGFEQRVERIDRFGVVHANDPFGPREVFDRIADVGRFPVENTGDTIGMQVEEHVLRSEVAVHDHRAVTDETGNCFG